MRFSLSSVALLLLAGGIVASGVVNNALSLLAVLLAVILWLATSKTSSAQTAIGLAAVCGWLFLAAVISMAFR